MLKRKLLPLVTAAVMLVSFTIEPITLTNASKPAVFEIVVNDVELNQPVVTVPAMDAQQEEAVPEQKVEKQQKKQKNKKEYSKSKEEVKKTTQTKKKEIAKASKPKKKKSISGISEEDIDLIALVTMAEAENQSEMGKRLVIDVILNRVESSRFSNSVHGVIYAKGQFTSMHNGRSDRCYVKKSIRKLVKEEIESRTNTEVLYFRAGHYHGFGTPVCKEGDHYFSTY